MKISPLGATRFLVNLFDIRRDPKVPQFSSDCKRVLSNVVFHCDDGSGLAEFGEDFGPFERDK
jgi:hypothetical protein